MVFGGSLVQVLSFHAELGGKVWASVIGEHLQGEVEAGQFVTVGMVIYGTD